MAKTRRRNELADVISRFVEDMIEISEFAESVDLSIELNRDSVPIISYKVDRLPIRPIEKDSDLSVAKLKEKLSAIRERKQEVKADG